MKKNVPASNLSCSRLTCLLYVDRTPNNVVVFSWKTTTTVVLRSPCFSKQSEKTHIVHQATDKLLSEELILPGSKGSMWNPFLKHVVLKSQIESLARTREEEFCLNLLFKTEQTHARHSDQT